MYRRCPSCSHQLPDGQTPGPTCPACGLVYAKWIRKQLAGEDAGSDRRAGRRGHTSAAASTGDFARGLGAWLLERAFHCEEHVNQFVFAGRVLVWLGLVALGAWFVSQDHTVIDGASNPIGEHFLHRVNLVFHEAGHVLFILFGDFMHTLGGSLGQLLMPAIVAGAFLLRHSNPFGAAVGVWWLGQSAVDLSVYIADAGDGRLLLLGGVTGNDAPGYHDWTNLLSRTALLQHDNAIAAVVYWGGAVLMLAACVWGAALLRQQWRHLDRRF